MNDPIVNHYELPSQLVSNCKNFPQAFPGTSMAFSFYFPIEADIRRHEAGGREIR